MRPAFPLSSYLRLPHALLLPPADGTINHPGLSASEGRLHYYVWAILPSPLIISFDPRTLPQQPGGLECLAMVMNPEILAVNQDPAVIGARLLAQGPAGAASSDAVSFQVFGRPLAAPRSWAAVLVNRAAAPQSITLDFAALGADASAPAAGRAAGARADLGNFTERFSAFVPAHDALFVTVTQ